MRLNLFQLLLREWCFIYNKIIEERKDGSIFSIDVVPNFELDRELIGFGEGLKILSPNNYMRRIRRKVKLMHAIYFEVV